MSTLSRSTVALHAPVPEVPVPDHGGHVVQFYHDDNFLLEAVSRFVGPALACGDAAVVIATQAHREGLEELLKSHGLDRSKAARQESKQGWRFLRISAVSRGTWNWRCSEFFRRA